MILITGATGFLGRSLAGKLTLAGREWRAYDGRINDPLTLGEQLQGIETVFHLAGSEARGRRRLLRHVDVEGTERLLEEARRAGVGRIIVPSRLGADPNSLHALLRAKGQVERLVRNSGIPYTILRSSTLYGRDDRFSEIILSLAMWSWPFVWLPGGGEIAMQPLWVEDYARCLITALDDPEMINKTISVAGNEILHYREIATTILDITGLKRLRFNLPLVLLRPLATLFFGWWYWPPVSRFMVDRFFVPEVTDLDAVLHHFGFQPARMGVTMAYLHRPGLRWRLFRK